MVIAIVYMDCFWCSFVLQCLRYYTLSKAYALGEIDNAATIINLSMFHRKASFFTTIVHAYAFR